MFLGRFCPMGIFSKKSGSVTHNYLWARNTMLKFQKKTNEPIPRKLTDGRKDGQTLLYRAFPAEAEVQQTFQIFHT